MNEPLKSPFAPHKRRKKVWQTEDQILMAIDRAHKRAKKLVAKEAEKKELAKTLFGQVETIRMRIMLGELTEGELSELQQTEREAQLKADKAKDDTDKCVRDFKRVMERTLPRLQRALAAMRTMTMPSVMKDYKGVVVT